MYNKQRKAELLYHAIKKVNENLLYQSFKSDFAGAGWEREVTTFTNHVSATKKTKVLIHGFINNGRSPWVIQAKNELLKKASLRIKKILLCIVHAGFNDIVYMH